MSICFMIHPSSTLMWMHSNAEFAARPDQGPTLVSTLCALCGSVTPLWKLRRYDPDKKVPQVLLCGNPGKPVFRIKWSPPGPTFPTKWCFFHSCWYLKSYNMSVALCCIYMWAYEHCVYNTVARCMHVLDVRHVIAVVFHERQLCLRGSSLCWTYCYVSHGKLSGLYHLLTANCGLYVNTVLTRTRSLCECWQLTVLDDTTPMGKCLSNGYKAVLVHER